MNAAVGRFRPIQPIQQLVLPATEMCGSWNFGSVSALPATVIMFKIYWNTGLVFNNVACAKTANATGISIIIVYCPTVATATTFGRISAVFRHPKVAVYGVRIRSAFDRSYSHLTSAYCRKRLSVSTIAWNARPHSSGQLTLSTLAEARISRTLSWLHRFMHWVSIYRHNSLKYANLNLNFNPKPNINLFLIVPVTETLP